MQGVKIAETAHSASWEDLLVLWEGRSEEVGVHTGLCEEKDRLWDPEVLQEEAHPPSLDRILGASFDHVDQAGGNVEF